MSSQQHITDAQMRAWRAFLVAQSRVLGELDRELNQATGLSLAWYDVLVQLHEAGEPLRMSDLSRHLVISPSATTRLVDRMERKGLVEREPCADDRRVTFVKLTDTGFDRLRGASPTHLKGVDEHFTGYLSPEAAATLADILEPILDAHS